MQKLLDMDHYFLKSFYKSKKRVNSDFFKKSRNRKSSKVIIYVGRLERVKRVEDLIDIYKNIKIRNVKLLIVGDGSLKSF